MRPIDVLTSVLVFAAASSAWLWPSLWSPIQAVKREIEPSLVARQGDTASKTSFDLSFSAAPQGDTAAQTSTGGSSDTTTGSGNGTTTGSGKASGSGKATSASGKTTVFDPRLPAGGVSMITPNAMSPASYYKIKDYVTFAWNYTSLSITPSAVDILASCSKNQATYTIAMNQSITGPTQAVTWDTGEYQKTATIPLLTETYTLIIHDAQKDVSATAQAGYLDTYEQFTFGMYTPEAYTPLNDWVCATCNSAMSSMERQTLGFLFGMAGVTVLSFGWFAGVAGIW